MDENISPFVAIELGRLGHDALHVRDASLRGAGDPPILEYANASERVLITFDADFAGIRRYPIGRYVGVIRLSLQMPTDANIVRALPPVLSRPEDLVTGALVVVRDHGHRVRRP